MENNNFKLLYVTLESEIKFMLAVDPCSKDHEIRQTAISTVRNYLIDDFIEDAYVHHVDAMKASEYDKKLWSTSQPFGLELNRSCEDLILELEEIERKKKIAKELDAKQIKFDFYEEENEKNNSY
jgi:hypothetical protein